MPLCLSEGGGEGASSKLWMSEAHRPRRRPGGTCAAARRPSREREGTTARPGPRRVRPPCLTPDAQDSSSQFYYFPRWLRFASLPISFPLPTSRRGGGRVELREPVKSPSSSLTPPPPPPRYEVFSRRVNPETACGLEPSAATAPHPPPAPPPLAFRGPPSLVRSPSLLGPLPPWTSRSRKGHRRWGTAVALCVQKFSERRVPSLERLRFKWLHSSKLKLK